MPQAGATRATRISIPKNSNVSPISDIHLSDMPSVVGSAAAGSSHQAAGKMRSERHCTIPFPMVATVMRHAGLVANCHALL